MINQRLAYVLAHIKPYRDLFPHMVNLRWVGMRDRRNKACIADLPCGTRFHPVQVVGALYEIGLRPHVPALVTLGVNVTPTGRLMNWGGNVLRTNLDPRLRRFGIKGPRNAATSRMWMPITPSMERKIKETINRGAKMLQQEECMINLRGLYDYQA